MYSIGLVISAIEANMRSGIDGVKFDRGSEG